MWTASAPRNRQKHIRPESREPGKVGLAASLSPAGSHRPFAPSQASACPFLRHFVRSFVRSLVNQIASSIKFRIKLQINFLSGTYPQITQIPPPKPRYARQTPSQKAAQASRLQLSRSHFGRKSADFSSVFRPFRGINFCILNSVFCLLSSPSPPAFSPS